jgi:hypothetical protein
VRCAGLVVGVAAAGCAGKAAAPPASEPSAAPPAGPSSAGAEGAKVEHGDIKAFDARERGPSPQHPIDGGKLHGQIESDGPPTVTPGDKSTQIHATIASKDDVTCFVYPTAMDPGGQLTKVFEAAGKNVDFKRVLPTAIEVVGDYPAVFVEGQYLASTPNGKLFGELKAMVYAHDTTPFLCMLDVVGYHATFKRVALGLAQTLELEGASPKASRYTEVTIDRIGELPTGFTRTVVYDLPGGGKSNEVHSTSFALRTPSELSAKDDARSEEWDKNGRIASIEYAEGDGGALSERIQVKRASGREYKFEGTYEGKKISGTFKTKAPQGLLGDAQVAASTKKLLAGSAGAEELHFEGYVPSLDPTAPVEFVMRLRSRADRTVTMAFGQVQAAATIDADGLMEKLEIPFGTAVQRTERAFRHGAP